MKLVIFGATGGTGRLLVEAALARGHDVTAVARDPERASLPFDGLRVVRGDVLDPTTLDAAVAGQDAVIFAVGSGNMKRSTLRTDGMRNVLAAMTRANVKRVVAMSGLGAGETRKNLGFFFGNVLAPLLLGRLLDDQNGLEAALRASDRDWTAVRPGQLKDGTARGSCRVSLDGKGLSQSVMRTDVATFILDQLASETYLKRAPSIGY